MFRSGVLKFMFQYVNFKKRNELLISIFDILEIINC